MDGSLGEPGASGIIQWRSSSLVPSRFSARIREKEGSARMKRRRPPSRPPYALSRRTLQGDI